MNNINNKKKILSIEDEERLQNMFKKLFEEEGYEFFSAYDGETGLKMAEEKKPDLILLDLVLPKKDGFETLKEIKSNHCLASVPVIVLTNLETARDVEKAISLGAHTYLVKTNYSLSEVVQKAEEALETSSVDNV